MQTHVVQKPFRDDGVKRLTGELVNALGWPLVRKLEDQRYIAVIPPGLVPVQDVSGRWWADRQFLRKHNLQEQRPPVGEVPGVPVATQPSPPVDEPERQPTDEAEWPKHTGGGWYDLSDGTRVKGKARALEAQAAIGG